jgi:hypothetical protein
MRIPTSIQGIWQWFKPGPELLAVTKNQPPTKPQFKLFNSKFQKKATSQKQKEMPFHTHLLY